MQTSTLQLIKIDADQDVFPNGITLISSAAFAEPAQELAYHVYIAGGRLADQENCGVSAAFQNAFLRYCDETCASMVTIGALVGETQDTHLHFRYLHHGRDNRDAICVRWLVDLLMHSSHDGPHNQGQEYEHTVDETDVYWTWFYKQIAPQWQRMHVTRTNENAIARARSKSDIRGFQKTYVHPKNILIVNSAPERHDEIAAELMQFPQGEGTIFRWKKSLPSIQMGDMDYPNGPKRLRRPQHTMIYIPLPDTWSQYFLTIVLLMICYGEHGLVHQLAKKRGMRLDIRFTTVFTPLPMARIFIKASKKDMRDVVEMIKIAPIALLKQWLNGSNVKLTQMFLPEAIMHHVAPQRIFIENWIAQESVDAGLFTQDRSTQLKWLLQTCLNESRFGQIDSVPQCVSNL